MPISLVILLVIALTCGPITIILGYRLLKKYKSGYLSAYLLYLLLFTAFGFFGYIVQAVSWEILTDHLNTIPALKIFTRFLDLAAGTLIIAALYFFILFCRRQVGKKTSVLFTVGYFLVNFLLMTLFLTNTITGMIEFFPFPPGSVTGLVIVYIAILPVLPGLKQVKDKDRQRTLKTIYLMYIALFSVYFILSFFIEQHYFIIYTFFALHFAVNLPPLLYMKRHLNTIDLKPPAEFRDEAVMENIFSQFGLSPREGEIAYMVLQGKSNREIEAELFISINTVKNHTSKIYQKFGVKNRLRLTNFLKNLIEGRG